MAVSVVGGFVGFEAPGEVLGFLGRREPKKFSVSPHRIEFALIIKVFFYRLPGVTSRDREVLVDFDNVARQFAKQADLVEICLVDFRHWIVMIREVLTLQVRLIFDGQGHEFARSSKFHGTFEKLGGEGAAETAYFLTAQANVTVAIELCVVERAGDDGDQPEEGADAGLPCFDLGVQARRLRFRRRSRRDKEQRHDDRTAQNQRLHGLSLRRHGGAAQVTHIETPK